MERLDDSKLLNRLVRENDLQNLFQSNVTAMSELFRFRKGEFLMRQGMSANYLYFLLSGKAEVYQYTVSDRVHCQEYFNSLECIGEIDVLWDKPAISNVVTLSECLCLGISLIKYRETLQNDLLFIRHVAITLANRLDNKRYNTLLDPLETRLASFILRVKTGDTFNFSLKECAEILDSSYRHLLRVMYALCESNILQKTDRGYQIKDPEALAMLSRAELTLH